MTVQTSAGSVGGTTVNVAHNASTVTVVGTDQLKTTQGKVAAVVVWGDDAGTTCVITLYDATSGTTNPKWRWVTADGKGTFAIQMPFGTGIRAISSGTLPTNGGITVNWS